MQHHADISAFVEFVLEISVLQGFLQVNDHTRFFL